MSSAQRLLDQVHTLGKLEALETEPGAYASELATELPSGNALADIEARDARLAAGLAAIDAMCTRAMRIRLEHALAADTSLAAPTRNVFAQTVVSYVDRLSLLADRVRDIAARGGARTPDDVADLVVAAARGVLELRAALRSGVLAIARDLAAAAVPEADRQARDREIDETQRKKWSAVRRDLELVAVEPARITSAPLATRVAALPEQLDDPAPEPERSFADMIEMD